MAISHVTCDYAANKLAEEPTVITRTGNINIGTRIGSRQVERSRTVGDFKARLVQQGVREVEHHVPVVTYQQRAKQINRSVPRVEYDLKPVKYTVKVPKVTYRTVTATRYVDVPKVNFETVTRNVVDHVPQVKYETVERAHVDHIPQVDTDVLTVNGVKNVPSLTYAPEEHTINVERVAIDPQSRTEQVKIQTVWPELV